MGNTYTTRRRRSAQHQELLNNCTKYHGTIEAPTSKSSPFSLPGGIGWSSSNDEGCQGPLYRCCVSYPFHDFESVDAAKERGRYYRQRLSEGSGKDTDFNMGLHAYGKALEMLKDTIRQIEEQKEAEEKGKVSEHPPSTSYTVADITHLNESIGSISHEIGEMILENNLTDSKESNERAFFYFAEATHHAPSNWTYWYHQGCIAQKLKMNARAVHCLDEAIKLDATQKGPLFTKAVVMKNMRRFQEAEEVFQSLLNLDPDHRAALVMIAETAEAEKKNDAALKWYRQLFALDPRDRSVAERIRSLEVIQTGQPLTPMPAAPKKLPSNLFGPSVADLPQGVA